MHVSGWEYQMGGDVIAMNTVQIHGRGDGRRYFRPFTRVNVMIKGTSIGTTTDADGRSFR